MRSFLMAIALAAGVAATAFAATDAPAPGAPAPRACFSSTEWRGWKARDEHTMYVRVNVSDIYEIGFKHGCRRARDPGVSLITVFRGSNYVCRPIDLDIKVGEIERGSIPTACIATSLRKLPADEAKAIPKQFLP